MFFSACFTAGWLWGFMGKEASYTWPECLGGKLGWKCSTKVCDVCLLFAHKDSRRNGLPGEEKLYPSWPAGCQYPGVWKPLLQDCRFWAGPPYDGRWIHCSRGWVSSAPKQAKLLPSLGRGGEDCTEGVEKFKMAASNTQSIFSCGVQCMSKGAGALIVHSNFLNLFLKTPLETLLPWLHSSEWADQGPWIILKMELRWGWEGRS